MSNKFETIEFSHELLDELSTGGGGKEGRDVLALKVQKAALEQQSRNEGLGAKVKKLIWNPITLGVAGSALGMGLGSALSGSEWYKHLAPSAEGYSPVTQNLITGAVGGTVGVVGGLALAGKSGDTYRQYRIQKLERKIQKKESARASGEQGGRQATDEELRTGVTDLQQNPRLKMSKREAKAYVRRFRQAHGLA